MGLGCRARASGRAHRGLHREVALAGRRERELVRLGPAEEVDEAEAQRLRLAEAHLGRGRARARAWG